MHRSISSRVAFNLGGAVALAAGVMGLPEAGGQQPLEKVAQESGDWNTISWEPGGAPVRSDIVHIEGGFAVQFTGGKSPNLGRLYLGDNAGGLPESDGTLEVSDGVLTVHANVAAAIILGKVDNSTGTLNILGGTFRGIGDTSGAGMQLGRAPHSTGRVHVSGGELWLGNGVLVGVGEGSVGEFIIEGGLVSIANSPNGGPFHVGGRGRGSNRATYRQTDGSVLVTNQYFGIGHAGHPGHVMNSVAEIIGGSFRGDIRLGRQPAVDSGGGSAKLVLGHAATVSCNAQPWEVGGNAEILFQIGPEGTFNAVNLTLPNVVEALVFHQPGAVVTVDGSELTYGRNFEAIPLIVFADGTGPSEGSQSNVTFEFTGFDPRFSPSLVWTDTSLQLELGP